MRRVYDSVIIEDSYMEVDEPVIYMEGVSARDIH